MRAGCAANSGHRVEPARLDQVSQRLALAERTHPVRVGDDMVHDPVRIGLGVLAQRPPDGLAQEEFATLDGRRDTGVSRSMSVAPLKLNWLRIAVRRFQISVPRAQVRMRGFISRGWRVSRAPTSRVAMAST